MKVLEEKKQLKRISVKVSSDLEITEIADKVSKFYGPALLFENVENSSYPLLINAFGTNERLHLSLEADNVDSIAEGIKDFIDMSNDQGTLYTMKNTPKTTGLDTILPVIVDKAPCQEVVEEPDLSKLPIIKCWPEDGGKSITLPLVITKDPETGVQNMGIYRLQVYDNKTTGMHWHLHKDGREAYEKYRKLGGKMPVSVAIGTDPATTYAATAPLPKEIDEMVFSGFLRKQRLEIVKSKTNDIYVPANAEFILEGYVDVNEELREEGPFGNHTGYYSHKDLYPVFHLTCITHKTNAVYPTTIVGKPPMENCYLGKATERIFLPLLKLQLPEIVDINSPMEGVFNNCVIVSIRKSHPGHAKEVIHAMWDMDRMRYTKMIIVVDENIRPQDLSTVAWKVFNNIDAKRDVVIVEGPLDALDHASNIPRYGHKMGIDATKKWVTEEHARVWTNDIEMTDDIKELVNRRWEEYGFTKD
ncbi:MAG: menaquinone biosynthesis decarboxylase [Clostridia bacterium]|jgi:4-hydroxy-3-polyprenylbenzoate decarboxylase|nr:menaquinone biosynthesis decarboxylase [Clostridia bacterium]